MEDHLRLLKKIFDFDGLKKLLSRPDFTFVFDGLHGVAGPYATRIFVQVGFSSCASQSFSSYSNSKTLYNICTASAAQHFEHKGRWMRLLQRYNLSAVTMPPFLT